MVKHKKAQSFKISKLKNLLEKPLNPSEVTRICDLSKSPALRHHSFKLDSKLKYQNVTNCDNPDLVQPISNKSQMD